ncbi:hypothetical protein LTR53_016355 [Teratosphaeriaceae sp. CCFEE 6253]|nr:hypothetical protein LTR53_016355 [Teratosphaeriaceae sp. CCFEE 6253]
MASAAEYHLQEFLTDIPNLPEGEEFLIYGTVYAHPEHADALEAVYAYTNEHAKSEPGILQYYLARDPDDLAVFHMFEHYASPKAFEEHNAQPIIQKLVNEDHYIKGVKAKFVKPIRVKAAEA